MKKLHWDKKGSDFFLAVSLVGCSLVFFLMFFLSLSVLQAQRALHVTSFVVPDDIREFKQFTEVLSFDDIKTNSGLRALLEEMMVRYYVETRYTIVSDRTEMIRRWGPGGVVWRLSSPRVFSKFARNNNPVPENEEKQKLQTINIISVDWVAAGTYKVVFDLTTMMRGKSVTRRMTSSLAYTYSKNYRIFRPDFSNPFGMVFVGFDVSEMK